MEQAEYEREKIDWSYIQVCVTQEPGTASCDQTVDISKYVGSIGLPQGLGPAAGLEWVISRKSPSMTDLGLCQGSCGSQQQQPSSSLTLLSLSSFLQFVDNQDVLDLIEGKMGILDLLDEQCR
jgi:hypothetical protein